MSNSQDQIFTLSTVKMRDTFAEVTIEGTYLSEEALPMNVDLIVDDVAMRSFTLMSNVPSWASELPGGGGETYTALTDAELRAQPVHVVGEVSVINQADGTPTDTSGNPTALTNAQLRATPVAVGGTVALDALTLQALELITVTLQSNTIVGLDQNSLNTLKDIVVSGTVALDAASIEAIRVPYIVNEIPGGAVNGSNKVFTTYYNFKPLSTRLFINGLRQTDPANYLETGPNQITLSFTPQSGDSIIIDYLRD